MVPFSRCGYTTPRVGVEWVNLVQIRSQEEDNRNFSLIRLRVGNNNSLSLCNLEKYKQIPIS